MIVEFMFELLFEILVEPTPASMTNIAVYWAHGLLRLCVGIAGIILLGFIMWMANIWWVTVLCLSVMLGIVYVIIKNTFVSIQRARRLKRR